MNFHLEKFYDNNALSNHKDLVCWMMNEEPVCLFE